LENDIIEGTLNEINAAFSVPYPEGDTIFIPSADHIFDAKEAMEALKVAHWQDIDFKLLERNRDRMSYLTPKAFVFYLPAFWTISILKPRDVDVMLNNVIFYLSPSSHQGLQKLLEERIEVLNLEQIATILRFFENFDEIFPFTEWAFTEREIADSVSFWDKTLKNRKQL
jgi:hypothetical protein